jgi:hypothetical protein
MGEWGTMCGEDLTRNEATVICKQLGFHAGINMPPGHFGLGPGEVILSELNCQGVLDVLIFFVIIAFLNECKMLPELFPDQSSCVIR